MKTIFRIYFSIAIVLVFLLKVPSSFAQEQYIYWVGAINAAESRGNTIFRYSINSGGVDTLFKATELSPEDRRYFYHVAVDTTPPANLLDRFRL